MSIGPGKYDGETSLVRELSGAKGIVLIVLGGNKGNGFSVQAPREINQKLPQILRQVADQIEADGGAAKKN